MAARENHHDYVRMMQRDILRVVDAVAPEDGSGAANVKVVRKVLQGLEKKSFLLAQTVTEIEECLKERDSATEDVTMFDASPVTAWPAGSAKYEASSRSNGTPHSKVDRKQIEQRIEEDRERHKRLRENIWAVPNTGVEDEEFAKMWEETSDVGEDDFILYAEEAAERREAAREWKEEFMGRVAAELECGYGPMGIVSKGEIHHKFK
ncbi:putative CTD kinase subunit gamma [Glarea lozoyensis 74030]|uniref:Putative CTD kinase subunit gamma n=1 Tax=Glarea lozoyensis (strain ATCC 74030 / MF5533) TaxID=1104152 RepID=H0EGK1_GLAL7|nr:putative CTD kinase subunit gamma [Glarea lozoyensis 74030]